MAGSRHRKTRQLGSKSQGDEAGGGARCLIKLYILDPLKDSFLFLKQEGSHWRVLIREVIKYALFKDLSGFCKENRL